MSETTQVPSFANGQICHTEVISSDVEATKEFMSKTFGWTYDTMPGPMGDYTMWKVGDKAYGGIVPPMSPEQLPSTLNYLAVENVQATADAITANGGTVLMAPMDVGDFGKMCVFQAPGGPVMAAWQEMNA